MPRRAEEVQFRIVKRHLRRDIAVYLWECQHQPGKERSICNFIDYGWTGRQGAILNAQVWDTIGYSVTRTIPAPHRTVVQS